MSMFGDEKGRVRLNLGRKGSIQSESNGEVEQVKHKPVERSSKIPAAGNVLRDRGRRQGIEDIGEIWSSKNIDDHIDVDDELPSILKSKLVSSSMRSIKRAIPKKSAAKQSGLPMQVVRPSTAKDTQKKVQSTSRQTVIRGIPVGPSRSGASTLDMVSARPRQMQSRQQKKRRKSYTRLIKSFSAYVVWPFKSKWKMVLSAAVIGTLVLGFLTNGFGINGEKKDEPQSLGAKVNSEPLPDTSGPDIVSNTEFPLLYPIGKSKDSVEVALVSPPNNAPVYAYVDTFNGVELRISQQEIPDSFKGQEDVKLEEVAKDFQATSLLAIDSIKVYYGYTERFGGVQSLVFIKDGVMVFISSAQKFSDDEWVGYILGLTGG